VRGVLVRVLSPPSISITPQAMEYEAMTQSAATAPSTGSPGLSLALGAPMLHVFHPFDEFIGHRQVSDSRRMGNVHQFPPAICNDGARIRHPRNAIPGDDPLRLFLFESRLRAISWSA